MGNFDHIAAEIFDNRGRFIDEVGRKGRDPSRGMLDVMPDGPPETLPRQFC